MRPKTNRCRECGAFIGATSTCCRACNLKRVGTPGWNRIGDQPLLDAERQARWRARNPERAKEVNLRRKREVRSFVADHKAALGCERCGITDPRVLDLHHLSGEDKVLAVSQMLYRYSKATIVREIEKCRVVCANCHRIEHSSDSDITAQGDAS